MKKVFVLMAVLTFFRSSLSYGQSNSFPSSGNVSIGATTAASNLHIGGAHGSGITFSYDASNNYRAQIVPYWSSSVNSRIDFNLNRNMGSTPTTMMSVGYNGNVGIGTVTPVSKLDVLGDVTVTESSNEARTITMQRNGANIGAVSTFNARFTLGSFAGYDAMLQNSSESGIIVKNITGNVGIGTTSPAEKLSVNGKIRAHEVKVETLNWPDYVFDKDFKLPTLENTESYINAHGHLPEIPSAHEVIDRGIELGQMNAKLLKKIEELTLYLIDQNKELKQLKKEVSLLKTKN